MTITLAERRIVGERAADDAGFRSLLLRNPRAAVEQAIGHRLDDDRRIDVVTEGDEWGFVLVDAEAMRGPLPDPVDVRTAAENHAYELLCDNPALADEAARDPAAFARDRLDVDLRGEPIVVHRDDAASVKLLVPNRAARESLSDEMLDLANGGESMAPTASISNRNMA